MHAMSWSTGRARPPRKLGAAADLEHFFKAGSDSCGRCSNRLDRTGNDDVVDLRQSFPSRSLSITRFAPVLLIAARLRRVFQHGFRDDVSCSATEARTSSRQATRTAAGRSPNSTTFSSRARRSVRSSRATRSSPDAHACRAKRSFGFQLSDKNFPKVGGSEWWRRKISAHRDAGFPLDVQVNDNRWRDPNGLRSGSRFRFCCERRQLEPADAPGLQSLRRRLRHPFDRRLQPQQLERNGPSGRPREGPVISSVTGSPKGSPCRLL